MFLVASAEMKMKLLRLVVLLLCTSSCLGNCKLMHDSGKDVDQHALRDPG